MALKETRDRTMTDVDKKNAATIRAIIKKHKHSYHRQYFECNTTNHVIYKYYCVYNHNSKRANVSETESKALLDELREKFPLVQLKTNLNSVDYILVFSKMPKRINKGYFEKHTWIEDRGRNPIGQSCQNRMSYNPLY